jgi:hypothetical protein
MTATTGLTRLAAAPSMVQVAVALGVIYVVWGSTYGAIRLMVEDMPPLVSAGLRFLTASILVAGALLVWHGPSRLAIGRRELLGCALIGLLLPVGGQELVVIGENGGAPSGIAALLIAAVPLCVICSCILTRERPTPADLYGCDRRLLRSGVRLSGATSSARHSPHTRAHKQGRATAMTATAAPGSSNSRERTTASSGPTGKPSSTRFTNTR